MDDGSSSQFSSTSESHPNLNRTASESNANPDRIESEQGTRAIRGTCETNKRRIRSRLQEVHRKMAKTEAPNMQRTCKMSRHAMKNVIVFLLHSLTSLNFFSHRLHRLTQMHGIRSSATKMTQRRLRRPSVSICAICGKNGFYFFNNLLHHNRSFSGPDRLFSNAIQCNICLLHIQTSNPCA
jgi:hypothetical protein